MINWFKKNKTINEMKKWIDIADTKQILDKWRTENNPESLWFEKEVYDYYVAKLQELEKDLKRF